jgi:hypothetical protein
MVVFPRHLYRSVDSAFFRSLRNAESCNLRFLNDGSRILVVTQRHKLGMTKPISVRPLQKLHLSNSLGTQPNAFLHLLSCQFIAPT